METIRGKKKNILKLKDSTVCMKYVVLEISEGKTQLQHEVVAEERNKKLAQ